jgi:hypothetical protein
MGAFASPLGILAGETTTQAMGTFRLSLIPTFFVPLLMIFHLIALSRVRYEPVVIGSPPIPRPQGAIDGGLWSGAKFENLRKDRNEKTKAGPARS